MLDNNTKELAAISENSLEKAQELVNEINGFVENGNNIIEAKELGAKVNNFFYYSLSKLEMDKATLNAALKPIREQEKQIKLWKDALKKVIDKKRFKIQREFEANAIKDATITLQNGDTGEQVKIVDQEQLIDDFKYMNQNFKKERLLKKNINIYIDDDELRECLNKLKELVPWYIKVEIDESEIKDRLIEAVNKEPKKDIKEIIKRMNLEQYGIKIEIKE